MSRIHYTKQAQSIATIPVYIEDLASDSYFFKVRDLPSMLSSGKQGFFILGDSALVNNTTVFVEIVDARGMTVFSNPIKNYVEGLARFVSLEVYNDTAPGRCTIYVVGESAYDIEGNPVPEEWRGKPNVRWSYTTTINPTINNAAFVRTYAVPEFKIHREYVWNEVITTKSTGSVSISNARLLADSNTNQFFVLDPSNQFVSDMFGGSVLSGSTSIGTVVQVRNTGIVEVIPTTASLWDTNPNMNVTMSYTTITNRTLSEQVRSYLDVEWAGLKTFSGQIASGSVYLQYADTDEAPVLLQTMGITGEQLLNVYTSDAYNPVVNRGKVTDASILYWECDTIGNY